VSSGAGGDTSSTSGSGGSAGNSGSGGSAGASAAGSDGGNATTADGGAHENVPTGNSAGCGKPPTVDTPTKFTKHDVMVTGVDPTFKPPQFGSWSQRNYFVKLPANYNPSKAYPVIFGGGGCGNTDGNSGQGGGFGVLPNDQDQAVLVGMSYLYPEGAGACFADGYGNTPELPYFDAMLAEVEADYCIAKSKVFIAGYSSGAWEAYTLGFARGGVIRGIATAAGGLRMMRPPSSNVPFAALLLTGAGDGSNPITGPTGSALARDQVLQQNGCVGTATTDWATFPAGACKQYTGCPAAYPVVWCTPGGGHTDGGAAYKPAIWSFWSSLPDRP
jgi:polyhydroxybutyrate depolymerase